MGDFDEGLASSRSICQHEIARKIIGNNGSEANGLRHPCLVIQITDVTIFG